MRIDPSLPTPRRPFPFESPKDKLLPSAARLRDLADRFDAEGNHHMAALTRRAADGVDSAPPPPRS